MQAPQSSKWTISELSSSDQEAALSLARELELSPIIGQILIGRGIRSADAARSYLYPSLKELHDPFLMQDMDIAVACIDRMLTDRRPIIVYGDYDVDGTTAVSLVYSALRDIFGASDLVHYYIPNRTDEGYGISNLAIERAEALEAGLIIALDCGIKCHQEIADIRHRGLEFIICDHHQPDATLPSATAVLDPKRSDCTYPCKDLSGCGVGYKLMQALCLRRGIDPRRLYNYLDLVAISIAADIVPLIGENRTLIYHGLKQLNSHPSLGVRSLMSISGIKGAHIDLGSIIYHLAPRINASGRMMDGSTAVALLTAEDDKAAQQASIRLDEYNKQRRHLDLELTHQVEEEIQALGGTEGQHVLVLYRPDWHRGVMGIVAARIMERYHLPTIILTGRGSNVIGSGRSMRGVDLYAALEASRHLLINFGGHTHAAGLTIRQEHIVDLRTVLNGYFAQHTTSECMRPALEVERVLELEEITPQLQRELQLLAPFGLKNERPLFVTYRMRDAGGSRIVGKDDQHLKLRITDRYCRHRPISAIALGQATSASLVLSQQTFAICYTIEENTYYGRGFLQLQVKAIDTPH